MSSPVVGLRIDVDTWRGTRDGVPRLCALLKERGIRASWFFSCGPDNMGRHIWRLLQPQFLAKMLRSNAPSLYGWDILLRGTLWPGPKIARGNARVLAEVAEDGHEIGVHAWDHRAWQAYVPRAGKSTVDRWTRFAFDALLDATGQAPTCAASPGWRTTKSVLRSRESFPFLYASDCRGTSIFRPMLDERVLATPQIPNTLPTYDEVIGQNGVDDSNYNKFLISQIAPDALNVLTIHAEVEGIARFEMFEDFLRRCDEFGITFVPLGELLPKNIEELPTARIVRQVIEGREGWVAVQET